MPQGFEKRELSKTVPTQRTYFDRRNGIAPPVTYHNGAEAACNAAGLS